ncbi:proton-conducting transporter membrane subunit [Aestuariivirga sp.]|uniref:proton-conducting transporter transmembrane domain-containing protein n=1 Tax=Aestuariivirga sp. TaxID=2650926 RepID=UPI00391C588A
MSPDAVLFLLAIAIPASYLVAAVLVRYGAGDPRRSAGPAAWAGAGALGLALLLCGLTALLGAQTLSFTMAQGIAPAIRLDAISLPVLTLVCFVGFVVIRFSRNYLDGDQRQHVFFARLLATLAATAVLALAGDLVVFALGWIGLSLVLHTLLVFYPERPLARLAARKKFIGARVSDLAILAAFLLLWNATSTTDIAAIAAEASQGGLGGGGLAAALLIALAALIKSAQVPFHGWLTEVMETPTPVSALLHAGIVNAGGFIVLRFSDVLVGATPSLWLLAFAGGGTALMASVVMLTQPRIKTQLAWSTIAQMGFMLLQCGLGSFSSALLHIIAHSLYKAHAFLWAGSAAERVKPAATPAKPAQVFAGFAAALVIFAAAGAAFGGALWEKPALAVLGSVVVLGMAQAIAAALAAGGAALIGRVLAGMAAVAASYYALQLGFLWLLSGAVASPPPAGPVMLGLMTLTLFSFASLSIAQALGLGQRRGGRLSAVFVHASNGFYANSVFNRIATRS